MSWWVTWSLVLGLVAAREFYRWRRDRRMDDMLRLLQWRGRFAQDRRELIDLIHAGEVDPRSLTVQTMYLFSSAVVRRATCYPEFSREVVDIAVLTAPKSESSNHIRRDLKEMTPKARELFHRFANEVHALLWDYSTLYRVIDLIRRFVPRDERSGSRSSRHRRVLGSKRLGNTVLAFHRTQNLCKIAC